MSISLRLIRDKTFVENVTAIYLQSDKPTIANVAAQTGSTSQTIACILKSNLAPEVYREERRLRYSRSKMGVKNPMKGKYGEAHHYFKGGIVVGKNGYLMQLRPAWFTGVPSQNHVPLHQVVMCEALGWTKVLDGFTVHHIDTDITNCQIDNLALLTSEGHARWHQHSHISKELSLWEYHQFMTWKSKQTTAS